MFSSPTAWQDLYGHHTENTRELTSAAAGHQHPSQGRASNVTRQTSCVVNSSGDGSNIHSRLARDTAAGIFSRDGLNRESGYNRAFPYDPRNITAAGAREPVPAAPLFSYAFAGAPYSVTSQPVRVFPPPPPPPPRASATSCAVLQSCETMKRQSPFSPHSAGCPDDERRIDTFSSAVRGSREVAAGGADNARWSPLQMTSRGFHSPSSSYYDQGEQGVAAPQAAGIRDADLRDSHCGRCEDSTRFFVPSDSLYTIGEATHVGRNSGVQPAAYPYRADNFIEQRRQSTRPPPPPNYLDLSAKNNTFPSSPHYYYDDNCAYCDTGVASTFPAAPHMTTATTTTRTAPFNKEAYPRSSAAAPPHGWSPTTPPHAAPTTNPPSPRTPSCFSISDGARHLNSVRHRTAAAASAALLLTPSGPSASSTRGSAVDVVSPYEDTRHERASRGYDSIRELAAGRPPHRSPLSSATTTTTNTVTASTTMTAAAAAAVAHSEPCCVAAVIFNNAKEVGAALCELPSLTVSLLQYADTAVFFKTTSLLHSRNPVEVLVPSTVVETEFVQTLLRQHGTHMTFTSVQRCFYNTEAGVQRLSQLKSSEEAALCIEDTDRYLCVAAANALILYMEHVNDMQMLPGSVRVRAEALEHFMEVSRTTARALQIVADGNALGVLASVATAASRGISQGDADTLSEERRRTRYFEQTPPMSRRRPRSTRPATATAAAATGPFPNFACGATTNWSARSPTLRAEALADVLPRACTVMGQRYLRRTLLQPLRDRIAVQGRHDAVEWLLREPRRLHTLRVLLRQTAALDLERLTATLILQPRRERTEAQKQSYLESLLLLWSALPYLQQLHTQLSDYLGPRPEAAEGDRPASLTTSMATASQSSSPSTTAELSQSPSPRQRSNKRDTSTAVSSPVYPLVLHSVATTLRQCRFDELSALLGRYLERSVLPAVVEHHEQTSPFMAETHRRRATAASDRLPRFAEQRSEEQVGTRDPTRIYQRRRLQQGAATSTLLRVLRMCFLVQAPRGGELDALRTRLSERIAGITSYAEELRQRFQLYSLRLEPDPVKLYCFSYLSSEEGKAQAVPFTWRYAGGSHFALYLAALRQQQQRQHFTGIQNAGSEALSRDASCRSRRRRVRCGTEELEYRCAHTQECVNAILAVQLDSVRPLVLALRQNFLGALQATVESVALLDTLLSFALYSLSHHCTRPVLVERKTGMTTAPEMQTWVAASSVECADAPEAASSAAASDDASECFLPPTSRYFGLATPTGALEKSVASPSAGPTSGAQTAPDDAVADVGREGGDTPRSHIPFFVSGAFHPSAGVEGWSDNNGMPLHPQYADASLASRAPRSNGTTRQSCGDGLCLSWGTQGDVCIITGPNACGKTTLLRILGQHITLAQAGCFVPARRAQLFLADRLFAHMLCEELPSVLHSTFKRELMELNELTHAATVESVVLMDELGRSTTTAQGFSLAWATALCLSDRRVHAVLTTHFAGLPSLTRARPGRVVAFHFRVSFSYVSGGATRPQSPPPQQQLRRQRKEEGQHAPDPPPSLSESSGWMQAPAASAGPRVTIVRFGHELFPGPCPQRWYGLAMAERMHFFEPVLAFARRTRMCCLAANHDDINTSSSSSVNAANADVTHARMTATGEKQS